jgi:hypothetical protein
MSARWYYFFCFIFFFSCSFCQNRQEKKDSLKKQLLLDSARIYRKRIVFPMVAADIRNSALTLTTSNVFVRVWGAKAGVRLFENHRLGIGGYSIRHSSIGIFPLDNAGVEQNLTFQYLTGFYEYSFINSRWWEIGVPIEAGGGYYKLVNNKVSPGERPVERTGRVYPLGAALDAAFKPIPWAGIHVMGGYRYVINNTSRINLSGWFYSIGATVYLKQIIRDSRYYFLKRKYKRKMSQLV